MSVYIYLMNLYLHRSPHILMHLYQSFSALDRLPSTQPPRLQRQLLQRQRPRPYKSHKRHHAHHNTQNVNDIVSVLFDGADAAAFDAAVLVGFEGAVEGGGEGEFGGGGGWRIAGGAGEVVDEF